LRSKELTPSSNDVRHVFNAAVTWMIPRLGSGPLAQVWNGWGVHFVVSVRSAFPFSVRATDFTNIAGQEFLSERYASLVPGVPIVLEDGTAPGGRRYNRAAFVEPPAGQQGDTTRNAYRGFGAQQLDLGLDRSLPLLRDARLHIRIDAFNLFNTPTFGLIVSEIANPSFGVPTSMAATGLSSLYRPGGPRSIALSIRVEY
jgi:hypothetical protein